MRQAVNPRRSGTEKLTSEKRDDDEKPSCLPALSTKNGTVSGSRNLGAGLVVFDSLGFKNQRIVEVRKRTETRGISESETDVTGYAKRYFVHRFRR